MHSVHATRLCPRMQLHITAREIINITRAHKRKLEKKEITQKVTRIINANGFPPSFELPFSLFYTHCVSSLQRRNLTRVISVWQSPLYCLDHLCASSKQTLLLLIPSLCVCWHFLLRFLQLLPSSTLSYFIRNGRAIKVTHPKHFPSLFLSSLVFVSAMIINLWPYPCQWHSDGQS